MSRVFWGFCCCVLGGFFWLFVGGFSSRLKHFHSNRDVTFTGEGLQNFDPCSTLISLKGKGSLASHTYYDTLHLIIWSYPRTKVCLRMQGEHIHRLLKCAQLNLPNNVHVLYVVDTCIINPIYINIKYYNLHGIEYINNSILSTMDCIIFLKRLIFI